MSFTVLFVPKEVNKTLMHDSCYAKKYRYLELYICNIKPYDVLNSL